MKRERVNRNNRCPICESDTWCMVGDEDVLCMRVQSDRPHTLKSGEQGWWHQLKERPLHPRPVRRERKEEPVVIDVPAMVARWKVKTRAEQITFLAQNIGVAPSALISLDACFAEEHKAWAFPMRNGEGEMVGVRLRNFLGDKWAVKGSDGSGLFMPQGFRDDLMVVVEGPTDTAAVLSIGMMGVGRPSCSGGNVNLIRTVGRLRILRALIIADNDNKRRPDGTSYNPGLEGALTLQSQLPVPSCLVTLPTKDIREFVQLGGTASDLEYIVKEMRWHYPERKHL